MIVASVVKFNRAPQSDVAVIRGAIPSAIGRTDSIEIALPKIGRSILPPSPNLRRWNDPFFTSTHLQASWFIKKCFPRNARQLRYYCRPRTKPAIKSFWSQRTIGLAVYIVTVIQPADFVSGHIPGRKSSGCFSGAGISISSAFKNC
jgi:hypothetical protein